jgi:hypothetical protein
MTMHDQRTTPASARARGFSFTEVLFAVMILGIGFIMVAAIFPVAIQQAKSSTEETRAAAVARGAANYLEKIASNSTMPATGLGNVVVAGDYDRDGDGITVTTALQGSAIVAGDNRYAWIPFYRRYGNPDDAATWSPFAQVYMVPVLARSRGDFVGTRVDTVGPPRILNNAGAAIIPARIRDGQNGAPDTVQFDQFAELVSEGCFVIIANALHGTRPWDEQVAPHLHGRVYRVGNPVDNGNSPANVWELMPGYDFDPIRIDQDGDPLTSAPPIPTDGKEVVLRGNGDLDRLFVFVVGRGQSPGDASGRSFEGTAQDVAAYTTFVNVK